MRMLTLMTWAATVWAAIALAQSSQITLVKNSPTNYGTNGFDISWVDNSIQKYYLADRTNNAIDLVDAATDTFLGFIGKGQYTGTKPCPGQPKDLRHCAGPNGVVTDDLDHVWAGDGAGNIIEADAAKPGTAIIRKIPTGGKFRVDEMAYDPVDQILLASSDGDSPPFLTFISVKDGSVLGQTSTQWGRMEWNSRLGSGRPDGFTKMSPATKIELMCSILTNFPIRHGASRLNARAGSSASRSADW